VRGPLFDTLIAAALLNPERRGNAMDDLARDLLGHDHPHQRPDRQGEAAASMLDVPLDVLSTYAAEDADVTWRLFEPSSPELAATDADLVRAVQDGRDAARARAGRDGARRRHDRRRAPRRVPDQLARAHRPPCAPRCSRPPAATSTSTAPSSWARCSSAARLPGRQEDQDRRQHRRRGPRHARRRDPPPAAELVLEYRELTKLLGTYVDPLPGYVSPTTGRLHASFHQTGAATGPAVVLGPQHPEHPHPQRRGPRDPPRLRRPRRRPPAARRRLLAGGAAGAGALQRGPGAARGVPRRPRHPRLRGLADLRGPDRGGHARPARGRQDGELRHRLRPDRVRAGAHAAHPAGDAQAFITTYKATYAGSTASCSAASRRRASRASSRRSSAAAAPSHR
jgi:hypothetical protein